MLNRASLPARFRSVTAGLLLSVLTLAPASAAQPAAAGVLLDITYYAQTPLHCGAAALAMVLRYWGHPSAVPADFSPLVDPAAGGITTTALATAAEDRGWRAVAGQAPAAGAIETLEHHVARGRPVIALVDGGTDALHYVVVVGFADDQVIVHDPARAPYTRMTADEFDRRWQHSSRWMLVVLPPAGAGTPAAGATVLTSGVAMTPLVAESAAPPSAGAASVDVTSAASASAAPDAAAAETVCNGLVADAVAAASTDQARSERLLRDAIARCPEAPAAYRELAGLRLVQRRLDESAALAAEAVARDARDGHAIDLLAASRFASGDRLGALQAWNLKGEPLVDRIGIEGLRRTPHPVVTGMMRLEPGAELTAGGFTRASRRLDELPSSTRSTLRYQPLGNGRVALEAVLNERRMLPFGPIGLASIATRALITRELKADVTAPFSLGDSWTPAFRWPYPRRRLALDVAVPLGQRLPGVIHIEMLRERQTYTRALEGLDRTEAMRRRFSATWADWLAGPLRVELGGSSDRHDGQRHFSVIAATTLRLAADHVAVHTRLEGWTGAGTRDGFHTADLAVDWRSTRQADTVLWTGRVGLSSASAGAPLALWPGAGSQLDRTSLLRGRRLVIDDVTAGEVFGRRLAYLTVERHQPLVRTEYGSLALATFADIAQAHYRLDHTNPSRLHVDVGAGLRAQQPGSADQLRVDIAVGLRDGRVRASAGYVARWGRR